MHNRNVIPRVNGSTPCVNRDPHKDIPAGTTHTLLPRTFLRFRDVGPLLSVVLRRRVALQLARLRVEHLRQRAQSPVRLHPQRERLASRQRNQVALLYGGSHPDRQHVHAGPPQQQRLRGRHLHVIGGPVRHHDDQLRDFIPRPAVAFQLLRGEQQRRVGVGSTRRLVDVTQRADDVAPVAVGGQAEVEPGRVAERDHRDAGPRRTRVELAHRRAHELQLAVEVLAPHAARSVQQEEDVQWFPSTTCTDTRAESTPGSLKPFLDHDTPRP